MIMTVDTLTNMVFQYYDSNRDGRIQLQRGAQYEGERLARRVQPGIDSDTVTLSWVSHERLFTAADRNKDGLAARDEIRDVIRFFDRNLDGQLENDEVGAFQRSFSETNGIIRQEKIARQPAVPEAGYSFYQLSYALARASVGVQVPSRN